MQQMSMKNENFEKEAHKNQEGSGDGIFSAKRVINSLVKFDDSELFCNGLH